MHELAPSVAFLHLTIDQVRSYLPPQDVPASATHLEPVSKMGCQCIEVEIEPITGEKGDAARGEDLPQGVNDCMRRQLRTGTHMEHRKYFREGVDSEPEPEHLGMAAEPCSEFVQLQMWEVQMAEGALMQDLCMFASTRQPGDDGGLSKAEDPCGSGRVQPFSQRRQDHGDLVRGGVQTIQGGVAPGSERGLAGLTAKGLDPLGMPMPAISDEGMDVSIGDPEIGTLLVGTGEALRIHTLGCSPSAFHLTPGAYWRRGRSHA